ncbi:hypothetical protein GOP47_0023720 [Adiantum capillus-veneris]|uniref:Uncharacterized protein n=1 Tax=Adiantum capillus-veneris TaxID=13818 RepID=A0A9D4U522_ADICA|nr:hypothetical protein GOP47_0023720 [Adiantum capillus-veneris]
MNPGTSSALCSKEEEEGTGSSPSFLSSCVNPPSRIHRKKIKRKLALAFSEGPCLLANPFFLEPHWLLQMLPPLSSITMLANCPAQNSHYNLQQKSISAVKGDTRYKRLQRVVCCPAVQSFVQLYTKQIPAICKGDTNYIFTKDNTKLHKAKARLQGWKKYTASRYSAGGEKSFCLFTSIKLLNFFLKPIYL